MRASRAIATLLVLFTLESACTDAPAGPGPRRLLARTADGKPLPASFACPTTSTTSESWVTFAGGALDLYGDGTLEWMYQVARGVRSWTLGEGGVRENLQHWSHGAEVTIEGTWTSTANGTAVLSFGDLDQFGAPQPGTAQVAARGGQITSVLECLEAPEGTPPHVFTIKLS